MGLLDEEKVNQNVPTDDIIDVDLSAIKKKRFRINGDDNKILELNVSDLHVLTRLQEVFPKLDELAESVKDININTPSDEAIENGDQEAIDKSFNETADALRKIDAEMREFVDYVFDSNVSEICASDGSMYDPFGGKYRYEHVIEKLIELYESNIKEQFRRLEMKTAKHAAKYTKKRKK